MKRLIMLGTLFFAGITAGHADPISEAPEVFYLQICNTYGAGYFAIPGTYPSSGQQPNTPCLDPSTGVIKQTIEGQVITSQSELSLRILALEVEMKILVPQVERDPIVAVNEVASSPTGSAIPIEYVKVCQDMGGNDIPDFFFYPGTDNCLNVNTGEMINLNNGASFSSELLNRVIVLEAQMKQLEPQLGLAPFVVEITPKDAQPALDNPTDAVNYVQICRPFLNKKTSFFYFPGSCTVSNGECDNPGNKICIDASTGTINRKAARQIFTLESELSLRISALETYLKSVK